MNQKQNINVSFKTPQIKLFCHLFKIHYLNIKQIERWISSLWLPAWEPEETEKLILSAHIVLQDQSTPVDMLT